MNRRRKLGLAAALALSVGLGRTARAMEVYKSTDSTLNVGGFIQALGEMDYLHDPDRDNVRTFLFLKQTRLQLFGNVDDYKFRIDTVYGAPEQTTSASANQPVINLLDAWADIPLKFINDTTFLKAGQMPIPYSREALTYDADLDFVDRSISSLGFNPARDVGAALWTKTGKLSAVGGVYAGGGFDTLNSFVSEDDFGVPLLAARVGYNDDVDQDLFYLKSIDKTPDHLKIAAYLNGFYMHDTQVGHSTVLNVQHTCTGADAYGCGPDLLIDGNWNPFIGKGVATTEPGHWYQIGGDVAARAPLGPGALSANAEYNYGQYGNTFGTVHLAGGNASVAYYLKPFEVAVRYGILFPDSAFKDSSGFELTGVQPIHEITPALTWYVHGETFKLVADLPIVLNDPVVILKGYGAFAVNEEPDEVSSVNASNPIERQTVVAGRLMAQFRF